MDWGGIFSILGQLFGFLALTFTISTYFQKNKAAITKTMMLVNGFYIVHYFLIGAFSGCFALSIGIFRDYYIYLRETHHKKHRHRSLYNNILVFFSIFAIYFSVILAQLENPLNILPLLAGLTYFIFEWFGSKASVKLSAGLLAILWLAYDIINFSIPGISTDTISILACVFGLLKDYKRQRRSHKRHHKH